MVIIHKILVNFILYHLIQCLQGVFLFLEFPYSIIWILQINPLSLNISLATINQITNLM
ncbi:hypothetical protein C1646_695164 [Rhizophagus diaphanus]|nr:hypothetical protein C1646_695164 [Rhizophagus diaphanus] [Rhizophagus sp. MUCL 43196]